MREKTRQPFTQLTAAPGQTNRAVNPFQLLQNREITGNPFQFRKLKSYSPGSNPMHLLSAGISSHIPVQKAALSSLIVEDSSTDLVQGQMVKSEFLQQLYTALYTVGMEEYNGTNLTVQGCPFITYWFDNYRQKESNHIETALRKYASASPAIASSSELIQLVCLRARKGFKTQAENGTITELPDDVGPQEGDNIIPEPEMIVQLQAKTAAIGKKGAPASNVIQRGGCCTSETPKNTPPAKEESKSRALTLEPVAILDPWTKDNVVAVNKTDGSYIVFPSGIGVINGMKDPEHYSANGTKLGGIYLTGVLETGDTVSFFEIINESDTLRNATYIVTWYLTQYSNKERFEVRTVSLDKMGPKLEAIGMQWDKNGNDMWGPRSTVNANSRAQLNSTWQLVS